MNYSGEKCDEPGTRFPWDVSYFPRIEALYTTHNNKFEMFKRSYRELYYWRNKENHAAPEIEASRLEEALHGTVGLYLFAAMVCAPDLLPR